MPEKRSTLTVFVIRHGERLDEALMRQRQFVPREIRRDPPLTGQGFQQGQAAFTRLAAGLTEDGTKRKIAIFTSPTKRTMGTSLMVAASGMGQQENLFEWGLQPASGAANDENEHQGPRQPIPITVVNGLGSCAAAIARCGGAEPAVEAGHLPCADFAANNGSTYCPAAEELRRMQQVCRQAIPKQVMSAVQYQKVERNVQSSSKGPRILPLAPVLTPHKFGTVERPQQGATGYFRQALDRAALMAAKIVPANQAATEPQQEQQGAAEGFKVVPHYCQQRGNERFCEALDRAVLLAESDGCDTVIAVAHREGVRELLDQWGTNGYDEPDELTYCCIASFTTKVYSDHSCRWCFHGVEDYDKFDVQGVPSLDRWPRHHASDADDAAPKEQHSAATETPATTDSEQEGLDGA